MEPVCVAHHKRGRIRAGPGSAQTDPSLSGKTHLRDAHAEIGSPKRLEPSSDGRLGAVLRTLWMMARKIGYTDPRMSQAGSFARRFLLIVLVLCATICAQSASITAEQETHQGSDHCCGLCHLGPAPVLPATASAVTAPVFSPVSITVSVVIGAPHDVLVTSSASRAPPA